jgi:imidazolonepropionase
MKQLKIYLINSIFKRTNIMILIGPFSQALPMIDMPLKGHIDDNFMPIIANAGIIVENEKIIKIGDFNSLKQEGHEILEISSPSIVLPGFIDCHTHICFAGSRSHDFTDRLRGISYQEILSRGGGIFDTVDKTRKTSKEKLTNGLLERCNRQLRQGITTCEVKSGYGLSIADELKMLRSIQQAQSKTPLSLIPTCLAAHVLPKEFSNHQDYLSHIIKELFPKLKQESLTKRVDIFIEPEAFPVKLAENFLKEAQQQQFDITVHADQFTQGGALLAAKLKACSADHLESSKKEDLQALSKANVCGVALPGASIGLGIPFAPVHQMLDNDLCVAIASDWNPGSAPMGDLLSQAAILAAYEKLSSAEVFAGITYRAAQALKLNDRGTIAEGKRADFTIFPTNDYREILYHQGKLTPSMTFTSGKLLKP